MSDLQNVPPPVEDAELERLMDALVKAAGWPASVAQRGDVSAIRRDILTYVSADTRRLDWLDETSRHDITDADNAPDNDIRLLGHAWSVYGECDDIRTAIDAAIRKRTQ